ncbi:hypothetical protein C6P45_002325, partial [Maudiozyma exigua]
LQLIPPSALTTPMPGNTSQHLFNSSQMSANMSGISLNHFTSNIMRRRDTGVYFHPSRRSVSVSVIPRVNSNIKRVLHFTKRTRTLQQLSNEIIEKIEKMYPDVNAEIEIDTLQDKWGCDLDPDFTINEVFASDNVVQVLLKNEIDWNQHIPVSGYANKRTKLSKRGQNGKPFVTSGNNDNSRPMHPPSTNVTSVLSHNENEANGIRRTSGSHLPKGGLYKGIRVSTPLIHEIHPTNSMIDDNDGEGNHAVDPRNKSILPPPSQPQSPPIRISSSMEVGKRIKSSIAEDTVSRSETFDPDKAKQQRLQFSSPHISITTPNDKGETRKNSDYESRKDTKTVVENNGSNTVGNIKNAPTRSHQSLQTPRVDKLDIQNDNRKNNEPHSGSTHLLNGSSFTNRIPVSTVRTLYSHQAPTINAATMTSPNIDDVISISQDQDSNSSRNVSGNAKSLPRMLKRQQSSIADNNGSPVKNNPIFDEKADQVHLAALPDSAHNANVTGKKSPTESPEETERASKIINPNINKHNHSSKRSGAIYTSEKGTENDFGSQETVANSSFQKKHLVAAIHSKGSIIPAFLKEETSKGRKKHSKSRKPYTTVLHKDIDNSKPDPRNILPRRIPRNAARKAVQKLSGNIESGSEDNSLSDRENGDGSISTSSTDSGSEDMEGGLETDTGIETDYFSENSSSESCDNSREVPEPRMIINIDPIKEKMVTDLDTQVLSSQNVVVSKEPEKQSQHMEVPPKLNEINRVIPDSQGTLNSHQSSGSALLSESAYKDSNSLRRENHGSTIPRGRYKPNENNKQASMVRVMNNFQSDTTKVTDTDSNELYSANTKYPTKFLDNQLPKMRPSLQTIMDVKEKDFQLTTLNNVTHIPLDQDASTEEETLSELE